jgi:pyruvate kinase
MALKIVDHQRTKIVATIGPASSSAEMLLKLVQAGVNVFRLNFSHGNHEDHKTVIDRIVAINKEHHTHVAILADLQGPKLRIGDMEDGGIDVAEGDILTFVNEPCVGTKERIYMSYSQFAQDVKVGESVLVDDGKLLFKVIETNKTDTVKLKVHFGGKLSSRKGVNLPNTKISLPSLTEKDERDLAYILTQPDINWIALSFVRKAEDMKDLRRRLEEVNHPAKILAKIEKPEAIKNIDKIIKASNGIMVARGDLGIEIPIEQLPLAQKMIIRKCIQRARPVIVATHMLDSMITSPTPTRAEVTDVANAVLDGTDAVMLSGETSVGRYPAKVVEAMNKIIEEAEKQYEYAIVDKRPMPAKKSRTFLSDAICFNAAKTADEVNARALVGMTASGYTAFKLSSYRPKTPIFAFSDSKHMLKVLALTWGVRGYYYDKFSTTDETIEDVTHILKDKEVIRKGDIIVNTGSMPIKKRHRTNMLKITVVE